jgi:hypothetical protein
MATCKWCGRSGWLLSISANGMCDTCEATEVPSIVRKVQIIQESQSLVESGKSFKARVDRCDDIIRIAEKLIPYELKGITVVEPPAAELKAGYELERRKIVTEHFQAEVQRILKRAELMGTPQSMVTEATKALLKIGEAREEFGVDDPILDESEHLTRHFIHKTQLSGYLQEAEKAEFKGNREKALDQYQEALFFLTTEGVNDGLRTVHEGEIESKIREPRAES